MNNDSNKLIEVSKEAERDTKVSMDPVVILAGTKADLLGLTEPVHMCSNCWNSKAPDPFG